MQTWADSCCLPVLPQRICQQGHIFFPGPPSFLQAPFPWFPVFCVGLNPLQALLVFYEGRHCLQRLQVFWLHPLPKSQALSGKLHHLWALLVFYAVLHFLQGQVFCEGRHCLQRLLVFWLYPLPEPPVF